MLFIKNNTYLEKAPNSWRTKQTMTQFIGLRAADGAWEIAMALHRFYRKICDQFVEAKTTLS